MMTDIEIAQSTQMLPITQVANKLGVDEDCAISPVRAS